MYSKKIKRRTKYDCIWVLGIVVAFILGCVAVPVSLCTEYILKNFAYWMLLLLTFSYNSIMLDCCCYATSRRTEPRENAFLGIKCSPDYTKYRYNGTHWKWRSLCLSLLFFSVHRHTYSIIIYILAYIVCKHQHSKKGHSLVGKCENIVCWFVCIPDRSVLSIWSFSCAWCACQCIYVFNVFHAFLPTLQDTQQGLHAYNLCMYIFIETQH